jgi:myo-inositol 2-dehydrogenase / D-chiro-inositol 1-dehydrogenase
MRAAVVGCGRMGRERATAARSFGVEKLLLFDEDISRAELLANECPGACVLKGADALFDEKLDALFICTPPFCRGPLEVQAIDSGVPLFVEKPIGVESRQLQRVLEKLEQNAVLTAVGYMNRYRNSVSHVRSILQSRKIIGISAHWIGKRYGVPWWGVIGQSGGPFNEQATHAVDLFRHLAGVEQLLFATAHAPESVENTVMAVLRLSGGGLGSCLYSCEAKDKDIFLIIETPDGALELRGWDLDLVRNTIDGSQSRIETMPIFEKETHVFLQAVTVGNGDHILADFKEAYQTQLLMDRIVAMIRPSGTNH